MSKTKEVITDPITTEHTVTIEGHTYTLQKLGMKHVFKVARVLGNGIRVIGDANSFSPGEIMQVFVASMARNEDEVMSLIGDVLGVTRKELDDPERFPLDSIVDVFAALKDHQDLQAFLGKVMKLMEVNPEMQTASREPSTS